MFELQWYWMLFLIPLPLLVRWLLKPSRPELRQTLNVPFIEDFQQPSVVRKTALKKFMLLLAILAWITFIFAMAKPIWIGDPVSLPVSARNLIIAVDLSGSMQERDFKMGGRMVSRLKATKKVAIDFINRRDGDRIGLILFGDQAYLQAPLTLDRKTVSRLLSEAVLGLAGERTALGDAIGLAVKRVYEHPDQPHVLVLMTDGATTVGVDALEAAKIAAQVELKIYTVGIGSVLKTKYSRRTDLDEDTLKEIANITGGDYFQARNVKEFTAIYKKIDELEPVERKGKEWRPRHDLFHLPLALAFGLLVLLNIIRIIRGGDD